MRSETRSLLASDGRVSFAGMTVTDSTLLTERWDAGSKGVCSLSAPPTTPGGRATEKRGNRCPESRLCG